MMLKGVYVFFLCKWCIAKVKQNNQGFNSKAALVNIWVNNYIDWKQTEEIRVKETPRQETDKHDWVLSVESSRSQQHSSTQSFPHPPALPELK